MRQPGATSKRRNGGSPIGYNIPCGLVKVMGGIVIMDKVSVLLLLVIIILGVMVSDGKTIFVG